jgi:hypothetical protein
MTSRTDLFSKNIFLNLWGLAILLILIIIFQLVGYFISIYFLKFFYHISVSDVKSLMNHPDGSALGINIGRWSNFIQFAFYMGIPALIFTFINGSKIADFTQFNNKPIGKKSLPYRELPAHFNCRSIYVPILKSAKEIGFDIPRSTRSSMDGQVPEDMNFKDFLEKKGTAFQDEVLGKGKAQLWRDGKITLQQLLDQTGNPIPLKDLDK